MAFPHNVPLIKTFDVSFVVRLKSFQINTGLVSDLKWHEAHVNGLVQEKCNSNALGMELRLSCTNPLMWCHTHEITQSLTKLMIFFSEENKIKCCYKDYLSYKQGKSEGFESCDWPIVWKRPIWVKMGDVLSRVTLKFDGWPWKTIGHLSVAVSSFVQHFIAIGKFKLELQSGNAQFGSNSSIFRAVWPWNLRYDLEKQ